MRLGLNQSPNSIMKFWACIVSLCVFLLACPPVYAQNEKPFKVLVLHEVWNERSWEQRFDRQFSTELAERLHVPFEISYQNLDLSPPADAKTIEFYRQVVNTIIETAEVDLLVAVLPTAIEFAKNLDAYMALPMVLTLPSFPYDTDLPEDRFRSVNASIESVIQKTLLAAIQLHPQASKIEVFSGPSDSDNGSIELTRQIVAQNFPEQELVVHGPMVIAELESYLGSLTDDSIAFVLPYLSVGTGRTADTLSRMKQIAAASSLPLYGFSDSFLGSGLAGGNFYTVELYANSTVDAVISLLEGEPQETLIDNTLSTYIFDYDQVQRHNLKLSRLETPYIIRNEPSSLFNDYRNTVYLVSVVFIIFFIVLYQLVKALKKSESTKAKLQLSERLARESQLRYELLTKNTLDVIWTWDQEKLQTTYCSPSIIQLTGYTAPEFMAMGMREVMTESSAKEALSLVFAPTRGSGMFDIELIHKDGSKIWCEIAAQPIVEEGKEVTQWVGITRDVSKRKREESERLALEGQLRQVQKFESLGTLAGGIAHDFNNMLGVMVGLNELLKLKIADNPAATAILDKSMATTERAKGLVGQILAFNRQSNLNKVEFNLGELAADALQLIQSGMPKSVKLEQQLGDAPIQVFADSNQISQVLVNILTNAFEALESEQGEIDFSIHEVEITSEQECLHGKLEPGLYAKIVVTDNGLGVSEDRVDKIFDPFYTSKDLGSGMGLSIARGIVMAHSGGIDFRSTPFQGSVITVYLPARVSEVPISPQLAEVAEGARSTILLIDDQADLLETMGMMLEVLGHDCIQCSDPREAMELIAGTKYQFDLVITDYSMPDITGLDIANLCADKRPSIPVILATGYNDSTAFLNEGVDQERHILSKPFGFDELKVIINSVL